MDIESIRAHCLSLPQATEDLKPQWGDALLFRIAGKIFASMSLSELPLRMNVKCTPERFTELLEVDGVEVAAYVGRYQWITFPVRGVFRDPEIRELVRESYENVRRKLPKKALATLEKNSRTPVRRRPSRAARQRKP